MKFAAASSISKSLRDAFSAKSLAFMVALAATLALAPAAAFGQCTLTGTVSTWNDGNSNWNNGANWIGGVPNSSTTSACITDGTSTVTLDINATVDSLQLASGNALDFNGNTQLTVYGSQILNAGQININGGGNSNSYLYLAGANVTLSGGGTVSLKTTTTGGGGNAYLETLGGTVLNNVDNTIQGEGIIYNNGATITNQSGGTINANSTGSPLINTLTLEYGTVNNAGLMEATASGDLELYNTTVNNAGGNITASGSGASVTIVSTSVVGGTLNGLSGGFIGSPTSNTATLDGSTGAGAVTVNGTYTVAPNSQTYIYGSIVNKGNFQVNGGGNSNSYLYLNGGNPVLTGGGTVSLSTTTAGGGGNAYLYLESSAILDNVNNTIQGEGIIYNNGTTFNNHVGGTINANSTGSPLISALTLEYGTVNNAGLMEATGSGVLQLYSTIVNNAGGNITASGSGATVQVLSSTIVGGTLNNNGGAFFGAPTGYTATLDGSTGAGAITLNGTYTIAPNASSYLYGSIVNNGNFQVNGGGNSNTYLYLNGGNPTFTGGGTVSLSTSTNGGGGNANLYLYGSTTLDNMNNTIQGEGIIYNNGAIINNHAAGIINANFAGGLLINTLTLEYGTFNNTGLMEATNNGSLALYSTTVNNAGGGVISANGSGASVILYATTIQGGSLNNNGGAFFGTSYGYTAYLDGSTGAGPITLNGTYTSDFNSNTYLYGSIINTNNLQVNGGNNTNTYLYDTTAVTLSGGGTLSIHTDTTGGGGNANLYLTGGTTLDNVDNTIQGEGVIYNNGAIFNNHAAGIINANSAGSPLINTLELYYGTFNNNGLMEATNNGDLQLYNTTVNNAGGGVVSANGPGASVTLLGGTTIQGGSLNNNGGAFLGTASGNTAYLDGSTTAGALTLNGTYTGNYNSNTYLYGTINNQGNLLVNGGNGNNTYLWVNTGGTVTLTGGGTVSLSTDTTSGGGDAWFYLTGGSTLDNINNTIQGEGIIYGNGATILNGGTILANSTGSPLITSLTIDYATLTNNGTMQADAGNLLHMFQGNLTNFSGNTLTGGAYNIYGTTSNPGTMQVDSLGTTGGEIINNAATIYLNGPNSDFVDQASKDALSNFSNNTSAGSFTITNGRNFTSPGSFANAGAVNIGTSSTFTTGGSGNYNQSAAPPRSMALLVAGGGHVNINGGTLLGNGGTITGNVSNGDGLSRRRFRCRWSAEIAGNYIQTVVRCVPVGPWWPHCRYAV